MDGSSSIAAPRLGRGVVLARPSPRAPGVDAPLARQPAPRRKQIWAALSLSATLHGVAALTLALIPAIPGLDASGEAGENAASLPEQPPVMAVELLSLSDLVSDAQPDLGPAPQALTAPTAFDAPPQLAEATPPPLLPALDTLIAPVGDSGLATQPVPPPPQPETAKPADAPKPKAKTKSVEVAAGTKAKGVGKGTSAGSGGKAKAAVGPSKAELADLKAEWGATIRAKIERKRRYPAAARGASGTVKLRLTVARSGELIGVKVAASSGNAALDGAALAAVQAAGKFPAAPKALKEASYSLTLSMKFAD